MVDQQATLKADHNFYVPKVTSHWQPKIVLPRLWGFVGDARTLVTNSEPLSITLSTY